MPYDTIEQAIEIVEDTSYGLASYIQATDLAPVRDIAGRLRTGNVHINYPAWDAGVQLSRLGRRSAFSGP